MGQPVRYLLLIDIDGGAVSADDLALGVDLPGGVLSVPYAGAFIATGGSAPYTYSVAAGSLPTGLSLDGSTGLVTGTPSVAGYFEFTAAVTDSLSATDSKVVAITVVSGIVVDGSLPPGEVGIAYSSGLSATGGVPPYTWSVPSGTLPTSTSINASTGIISGTPSADGTFNFTVRATDSNGDTQDFPTRIVIATAVDISTSTFPDGIVGVAYSAGPTTIGGVAPFTYAITSGAIPAGCNFSPASGFVTGTPTTAAAYSFDVTVVDALGGTDTFSASVTISAGGGGGSGTVTIVSAGNLSPLFTSNVANPTTTPVITFALVNQTANLVYAGPSSGGAAAPTFRALVAADLPDTAVTPGSYGDSTHVATFTVDAQGRLTAAASVAISSFATQDALAAMAAGSGEDGNADFDGTNTFPFASKTGSVYTLTRNVALDRIRITTGCTVHHNGWRIWAKSWDCTVGFYGVFTASGNNGGNASGATAGAFGGAAVTVANYFAVATPGTAGSVGTTGSTAATSAVSNSNNSWGASGTRGGQGGSAGANTPGTPGNPGTASSYQPVGNPFQTLTSQISAAVFGAGCGGSGGTGGCGDGTNTGGGGGGGGGGGAGLDMSIGEIITDGGTPAGMVTCNGGDGGNGATPVTGNVGGGGGGGPGGAGAIRALVGKHTGSAVTDFFKADGGKGGDGGAKVGTGNDGNGVDGATSGRVFLFVIATGTWAIASQSAGSAHSGKTGGAGGQSRVSLA